MEMPKRHKESADEEYALKRVLCTTETVIYIVDNKEPLNVRNEISQDGQPSNLDQSSEFYKTKMEEGKHFPALHLRCQMIRKAISQ